MRSISWVGYITYSSYLIHFPLQLLVDLAVSYGLLNSDFCMNLFCFPIYFLVLILLSYMVFVKFERPIQKMIRSRLLQPNKV